MIARNEACNLATCLSSVAGLFDETVVVDTGSVDATKQIAAAYGPSVFDFPWRDHFAAARNEAIHHAGGHWLFWLDADEFLDETNRNRLRELLAGLTAENVAYVLSQRSPDRDGSGATLVRQVRLFRNRPEIHWSYRVHEQLLPSSRAANHDIRFTDFVIQHSGYADPETSARKLHRNLRLLQMDYVDQPDDPFVLFNLGWAYDALGRSAGAIPYLKRSLERSLPEASIVRKLYALLAGCHRSLGQLPLALEACTAGRAVCPDEELAFLEGQLRLALGDAAGAEASWLAMLSEGGRRAGPSEAFASYDEALHGPLVRHHLAGLCLHQGRTEEAQRHWEAALSHSPGYAPAWAGLSELLLRLGRWSEQEQLAAHAVAVPPAQMEGKLLRARGQLARREFAAARTLLEEAVAAEPDALRPRILLSHALLQEGSDLAGAERTLREIVSRDPTQAEPWRNLALVQRQQGRTREAATTATPAGDTIPTNPHSCGCMGSCWQSAASGSWRQRLTRE
jgi:tetratricopeptide (TPR) repeat protein